MTKTQLADYIKVYDGSLSPEQCDALIARFEASPAQQELMHAEGSYRFVQLSVTKHWPTVEAQIGNIIRVYLHKYHESLGIGGFWPPNPLSEEVRLKRYLPDGRESFAPHVDVMDLSTASRFITAILYLNTCSGGETFFPELHVSVAPAPGRLVVFPPLWTFPHAGLPPRDRAKYIVHTYLWYPPAAKSRERSPG
jgi:hypothetical protein